MKIFSIICTLLVVLGSTAPINAFYGDGDIFPPPSSPLAMDCGDGDVNYYDILEAIDIARGIIVPTPCQLIHGDTPNGIPPYCGNPPGNPNCETDGDIDIFDALVIRDHALEISNCYDYCSGNTECIADQDCDEVIDSEDNCLSTPNGPGVGTCIEGNRKESTCADDGACGSGGICSMDQQDNFPPGGNGIGNACECEGDFDSNGSVDGYDVRVFKADYGRNQFNAVCSNENPCKGDFDCDGDVDSADAAILKQDFGRNPFKNPCPLSQRGEWCSY